MDTENKEEKVIIPYKSISQDALRGVIENFILREGTDYGVKEYTYEEKQNRVIKQLNSGYISVIYDSTSESCTIIKTEELSK